jgi:hypothetical protein
VNKIIPAAVTATLGTRFTRVVPDPPAGLAEPHSPLQIGSHLERLRNEPLHLLGREHELAVIREHLRARRSLFVCGPAGAGKTTLLHAVYAEWNAQHDQLPVFYSGESNSRRRLATHLLVNLLLHHGQLRSEYIGRRTTVASLGELRRFVEQAHVPSLKRMMHQNLARQPGYLFLDHLDHPDPKIAGLIEVWLETVPLVVVARDAASVGRVRWLLSAFEQLPLSPLPHGTLVTLVCESAARLGVRLTQADIDEVAKRSSGNPERLHHLLRAAAQPKYERNGIIQWKLVDLDLRIRAIGLAAPGHGGRRRPG